MRPSVLQFLDLWLKPILAFAAFLKFIESLVRYDMRYFIVHYVHSLFELCTHRF